MTFDSSGSDGILRPNLFVETDKKRPYENIFAGLQDRLTVVILRFPDLLRHVGYWAVDAPGHSAGHLRVVIHVYKLSVYIIMDGLHYFFQPVASSNTGQLRLA